MVCGPSEGREHPLSLLLSCQLPQGDPPHTDGGQDSSRGTYSQKLLLEELHLVFYALLGIQICRIRMFLALPDPDPLLRGIDPDPDPSFLLQRC